LRPPGRCSISAAARAVKHCRRRIEKQKVE
jgi:hypothetical protein